MHKPPEVRSMNLFSSSRRLIPSDRVNVGGKLDVVCFDKTGTLTEDGLDVLGARTVVSKQR